MLDQHDEALDLTDWTEDRYECIQWLIDNSDHHWAELNKMSTMQLSDMVRYDLTLDEEEWLTQYP